MLSMHLPKHHHHHRHFPPPIILGKTKIEIWKSHCLISCLVLTPLIIMSLITHPIESHLTSKQYCRFPLSAISVWTEYGGGESTETHFLDIKIQRHDSWQPNRDMIEDVWERGLLWDSFSHYAGVFIHEVIQGVDFTRWNQVLSALMAKRLWQAHQQKNSVAHHLW